MLDVATQLQLGYGAPLLGVTLPSILTAATLVILLGIWARKLFRDRDRRIRYYLIIGICLVFFGSGLEQSYWLFLRMDAYGFFTGEYVQVNYAMSYLQPFDMIRLSIVRGSTMTGGIIVLHAYWSAIGYPKLAYLWAACMFTLWASISIWAW